MIRIFDVETTGLDPKEDRVIEIAAYDLDLEDGSIVRVGSHLCNPGRPIPPEASAVHHLTDADVASAPLFGAVWAEHYASGSPTVYAAHNCDTADGQRRLHLDGRRPRLRRGSGDGAGGAGASGDRRLGGGGGQQAVTDIANTKLAEFLRSLPPPRQATRADYYAEFVYFARLNEWIKIGFSTDWAQRLRALQRETPYAINQFIVIRGGRDKERDLHAKFAHLRGSGEWFAAEPDLEAFLKAIPIEERVR